MSILTEWHHWYKIHIQFTEALLDFKTDVEFVCWFIRSALWKPQRATAQTRKLTHLLKANKHNLWLWMSNQLKQSIHLHTCIACHQISLFVHHHFTDLKDDLRKKKRKRKQSCVVSFPGIMTTLTCIAWSWHDAQATWDDISWNLFKQTHYLTLWQDSRQKLQPPRVSTQTCKK